MPVDGPIRYNRCRYRLGGYLVGTDNNTERKKMKNVMSIVTAIPASIGLVLVDHPLIASIVVGWFTYRHLKSLRG